MAVERPTASNRLAVAVAAALAAAVFLALATPRLSQQGLYYDELHQATASFAYLGQPAPMFNVSQVMGLPALNMNYAGAIKTGIYGLYMRLTGAPFSTVSWRLLALLMAAGGIAAFCLLAMPALPRVATLVIVLLVLSDVNLVLSVRHDWGPVALSFAMRMVLLGALLRRGELGPGPKECAIVGMMLGLIVFEKLSGVVVALPIALVVAWCGSGPLIARAVAFVGGGIVGAAPLIFLNARSFLENGVVISLGNVPIKDPLSMADLLQRGVEYVQLGAGAVVQGWILGHEPERLATYEGLLLSAALGVGVWAAIRARGDAESGGSRLVVGLVAIWAATGAILPFLPSPTGAHHWILGTPFHYVALGLIAGKWAKDHRRSVLPLRVFSVLFIGLLAGRAVGLVELERSLARGDASERFSPSLNRLGEFAASEPPDVLFVASTWGVAAEIVCLSNNAPDRTVEAFWSWKASSLHDLVKDHPDTRVFYVVALETIPGIPSARERVERDFSSSNAFVEEPLPAHMPAMHGIALRRFVRRGSAGQHLDS